MGKKRFNLITVQQAEKEEDSRLFVLNRSGATGNAGNVNFNVTNADGQRDVITVPIAGVPLDMSMFAEKNLILRNAAFRRLVASQYLAIVNTEEAADFVTNDPYGKSETAKVLRMLSDSDSDLADPIDSVTIDTKKTSGDSANQGQKEPSPFVASLLSRAEAGEPSDDLISELDAKYHSMSQDDLAYVANNCVDAQVKAWAAELIE